MNVHYWQLVLLDQRVVLYKSPYKRPYVSLSNGHYQKLQTLILDIDSVPISLIQNLDPKKDPEEAVKRLIKYLPKIFI